MRCTLLLTLLSALLLSAIPTRAPAATISMGLGFEFSGATAPSGPAPWATAVFDDDTGDPNTVLLTLSASGLVGDEGITRWLFNFDPALDVSKLGLAIGANSIGSVPAIDLGLDAFQADGDGLFDIRFDFPPPPSFGLEWFTAGEQVIYTLSHEAAINVSSFDFSSTPGPGMTSGPFRTAAHIQNVEASAPPAAGSPKDSPKHPSPRRCCCWDPGCWRWPQCAGAPGGPGPPEAASPRVDAWTPISRS